METIYVVFSATPYKMGRLSSISATLCAFTRLTYRAVLGVFAVVIIAINGEFYQ